MGHGCLVTEIVQRIGDSESVTFREVATKNASRDS